MFIDPNEGSAKDALAVTCQLHDNDRTSGNEFYFLISFFSDVYFRTQLKLINKHALMLPTMMVDH